ncbi:unnamed protein product [Cochlearia groenlandica]
MATIPSSFSFTSFYCKNPLLYYHHHQPQVSVSYLNLTKKKKKNGFVCFACSIKQTRVRKRVKSNEELRSEIMEVVALAGLPQGHVPSMKELSAHGRVDLANIVRRRGYKFIRELLANSDAVEDCTELISEEIKNLETSSSGICLQVSITSPTRNFEHGSVSKDESSLKDLGFSNHSGEVTENTLQIESVELNNGADIENLSSEASTSAEHSPFLDDTSSCSDRESDNVLVTENDEINDVDQDSSLTYDHYTTPDLNYPNHVDTGTELLSGVTSKNTMEIAEDFQNQQIENMSENRFGSVDDSLAEPVDKDWMFGISSSASTIEEKTTKFIQNGYLETIDDGENNTPNDNGSEETKESPETTRGGDYDGQRIVTTPPNGSAVAFEEGTHAIKVNSSDRYLIQMNRDQIDGSADLDKVSHDETMKRENEVEITRLRFMLRQKEMELSRLKEQIEKEKLSLSVLQRQAETEIQKAQMLVSEKDVELQEAEESLSGLQEVEIEYCGDGNVVEVTGSFNGWEHRVGLELQASKSVGKQKCWTTLLWLYLGTYEIKFIVDGQWITDPKKESVTRGHLTNNILKVDK